jgi:hypothetical protein
LSSNGIFNLGVILTGAVFQAEETISRATALFIILHLADVSRISIGTRVLTPAAGILSTITVEL